MHARRLLQPPRDCILGTIPRFFLTATRHTLVPVHQAEVELAAFPLASEAALHLGTTHLAPDLDEPTKQLWRMAESALAGASPALSLDEIGSMRDLVWFGNADKAGHRVSLGSFVRRIARIYLRVEGSIAVPTWNHQITGQCSENTRVMAGRDVWRWLSFALPPDLLLAGLANPFPPNRVAAVSPVLAAQLRQGGFTETHVHLGAAMSFDTLWSGAVHAIADSHMKSDALQSPGAVLDGGRDLAGWVLRASVARYLLGAFLSSERHDAFDTYLQTARTQIATGRSRSVVTTVLDRVLVDLCTGRLMRNGPTFAELQGLYADLTGVRTLRATIGAQAAHGLDPLHAFTRSDPIWPSPEMWLVTRGLAYMKRPQAGRGADDATRLLVPSLFERLFWQVVRVRCLLYRHVVQRPLTPGLQWFVRFFRRIKPLRRSLSPRVRTQAAMEVCGLRFGLTALELRISPEPTVQETLNILRDGDAEVSRTREAQVCVQRAFKSVRAGDVHSEQELNPSVFGGATSTVELGYIVHFARNRGGGFDKGALPARWQGSEADPSYDPRRPKNGNPSGFRFARHYLALRGEALVVGRLLTAFPITLELVRGVDVCTDEVGIPTWVVAPLVRYVRDASSAASAALHRTYEYLVPPIRTALHAGEDFVHLLSGMRRLGESIEYMKLGPGDRIGHGLSLGIDPERWARTMGRMAVTREDRLFDLVWAWAWMSRGTIPSDLAPVVEAEICKHATDMFDGELESPLPGPMELGQLVADLHDEQRLRDVGFPSGHSVARTGSRRNSLMKRYLTSSQVFARCKAGIWVDPAREGRLLGAIQDAMRRQVGSDDITVEVNPSSNLLIGHVPDLRDHPLWRLRPASHQPQTESPMTVCIGSDDPLTFATTLPQEYQLLHDALVRDGASATQAEQWLDDVRRAGVTRKFTVPRSGLSLTEPIPVLTRLVLPP